MNGDELKELVDTLKSSITHYMKQGDMGTQYYLLNDGTMIPQHANTVSGDKLLEDYDGDTYQNEYYRMLTDLLHDVEFECDMNDVDYEIPDNPLPNSVIPVKIY